MHEERRDQRCREHGQRNGGGNGEEQGDAQSPIEEAGIFRRIVIGVMLYQRGQDDGAGGHAEQR